MAKIWDLTNKELRDKLGRFLNSGLDWNAKVCLQFLEQLKDDHDEVRCEWDRLTNIFGSQTLSRIRSCLPGLVSNGSLRLLEKTPSFERYECVVNTNGQNGNKEKEPVVTDGVPYSEIDTIIKHYNLNVSQANTYRFLAQRCLELKTNAILVTAAQVAKATEVTNFTAYERMKSLQRTGLIYKVPEKSSTSGTYFKVALKMDDIASLHDSDVASRETVQVERAEKGIIPALIGLLRRSEVNLESKDVYDSRLKQAQADVTFYYQIVQNYDMLASALRKR